MVIGDKDSAVISSYGSITLYISQFFIMLNYCVYPQPFRTSTVFLTGKGHFGARVCFVWVKRQDLMLHL